ncbi:hypothetical protein EBN15_09240 [Xanthomonas cucurbitae]|nr:hypothetical protein EBN15_09175 [Xanthomonas cucurbitae]QHG87158.1 hypothetical protein EBN15_09240 [Xanthomonas cucurbitae]
MHRIDIRRDILTTELCSAIDILACKFRQHCSLEMCILAKLRRISLSASKLGSIFNTIFFAIGVDHLLPGTI